MALSKKEYSEMMKYLTRPATSSAQLGARAGFKEGTNPEKTKMILDMLRRGADVDTISTITGATVEEINNIAKTAKPISTEELSPEEPLSKNKTYSEIDILSNIDAKNPVVLQEKMLLLILCLIQYLAWTSTCLNFMVWKILKTWLDIDKFL
jgi:hypothetical protein